MPSLNTYPSPDKPRQYWQWARGRPRLAQPQKQKREARDSLERVNDGFEHPHDPLNKNYGMYSQALCLTRRSAVCETGAGDTARGGDREEGGDGPCALPGDSCGDAVEVKGKKLRGSGRHIGAPVLASEGTSQYVVSGYGNLIVLDEARGIRQSCLRKHDHTSQ